MDGLKQRIIGALVLISLAVIFVPMIFDEPHSERQSTPITIPEEPPFPEVDMPAQPQAAPSMNTESETPAMGFRVVEEPAQPAAVPESEPTPALVTSQGAEEPEPQQPARVALREPEQPKEFAKTLEGAWIVQLGSFGNADNARRLRDKVIDLDYGAHLQQVSSGETELTRVFSGPFVSKAEAEKAKAVLDKEFKLNSLVTSGGK